MKIRRLALSLVVTLLIVAFVAVYYVGSVRTYRTVSNRICLGTACSVTIYGQKGKAKETILEVWEEVTAFENAISVNLPYSEVSRANAMAGSGTWLEISEQTYRVVKFALEMESLTFGALNPALGSVIALWGIGTEGAKVPQDGDIQCLLPSCRSENIALKEENGRFFINITDPSTVLNLGAIGKGFGADIAVSVLKANGIENALIDFGGNVYVLGKCPTTFSGRPFRVGLQDPDLDRGNSFMSIEVTDMSVVTSGSYERFVTGEDGHRYSHIIDPKTGWSIEGDILSVSITGPSSAVCDALSTAFFILGPQQAFEVLGNGFGDYEAYFLIGEPNMESKRIVQVGSYGILE